MRLNGCLLFTLRWLTLAQFIYCRANVLHRKKKVSGQTKGLIWNDGFHFMHLPLSLKYMNMGFCFTLYLISCDLCGSGLISYMHTKAGTHCMSFFFHLRCPLTCSSRLLELKIPVSVYFQQISLCLSPSSSPSLTLSVPFSASLFQALQLDISPSSQGTPARNGVTGRAPL